MSNALFLLKIDYSIHLMSTSLADDHNIVTPLPTPLVIQPPLISDPTLINFLLFIKLSIQLIHVIEHY